MSKGSKEFLGVGNWERVRRLANELCDLRIEYARYEYACTLLSEQTVDPQQLQEEIGHVRSMIRWPEEEPAYTTVEDRPEAKGSFTW